MEHEKTDRLIAQIENSAKEQRLMASRMISGEKTIKAMSVYYAVFASITAVMSLLYPQLGFSRLSAMMTVMLAILTTALSAQKYARQARQCCLNAQMLEQLRLEADEDGDEEEKYRTLREKYGVLTTSEDTRSTHENRMVLRMYDIENRRRVLRGDEVLRTHYLCGYEKFKYWLVEIISIVFKTLIFLAPIIGMTLSALRLI